MLVSVLFHIQLSIWRSIENFKFKFLYVYLTEFEILRTYWTPKFVGNIKIVALWSLISTVTGPNVVLGTHSTHNLMLSNSRVNEVFVRNNNFGPKVSLFLCPHINLHWGTVHTWDTSIWRHKWSEQNNIPLSNIYFHQGTLFYWLIAWYISFYYLYTFWWRTECIRKQ